MSRSTTANLQAAPTTALRQNKYRFRAAIAILSKVREASPPACARLAAWHSLSRATSAFWKRSSGWQPTCHLLSLCVVQTRVASIMLIGFLSALLGRTHLLARLRLAILAGAATSAARRSRRTTRLSPGKESLTKIRQSSNCWSTRCRSAVS